MNRPDSAAPAAPVRPPASSRPAAGTRYGTPALALVARRACMLGHLRIQYVIQQVLLKLLPAVIARQHPLPSLALSSS